LAQAISAQVVSANSGVVVSVSFSRSVKRRKVDNGDSSSIRSDQVNMARVFFVVLCCVLGGAAGMNMNVDDEARAWLTAHQEPQDADLAVLKQADPRTFEAVRGLLNRQALGLLNQHRPVVPVKLSAKDMEQFKLSKATEDRKQVLSLEAKMFADKLKWNKMEASKATRLSKVLSDDKPKPKPQAAAPAKKVFRAQAPKVVSPEEEAMEAEALMPKKRISNLAESVSWKDLKNMVHAQKKAGGKVVAPAPAFRGPSLGWGSILTNMHRRQQEKLTGKNSALAGFSWGDDQAEAQPEKDNVMSTLSKSQSRFPALVHADLDDMPDQLADFIHAGKKSTGDSSAPAPVVQQASANGYSMDLN
jgi:hypothetical protein